MSDTPTPRMVSVRRCQYENPNLPKYIVPYEDAAQLEHELNQCKRELEDARERATTAWSDNLILDSRNRQLERELADMTKQRDALADALEKAKIAEMQLENADINLEQCRLNFVGRIKKLEQERDTLAEAMIPAMTRAYARGYNHGHEDTVESTFMTTHASDELTFFADDIRQMLLDGSQPEAQAALAAMKGASHE
jgi:exonuclease VII large subunit